MKCYLAGKMTGVRAHNIPAFEAAARDLRSKGWEIVSPVELDDPEVREIALASPDGGGIPGFSWGDFLSRDVKIVADQVQGIIFLPGWERSRDARLEACVALLCGHVFYQYPAMTPIPAKDVADIIHLRWGA